MLFLSIIRSALPWTVLDMVSIDARTSFDARCVDIQSAALLYILIGIKVLIERGVTIRDLTS